MELAIKRSGWAACRMRVMSRYLALSYQNIYLKQFSGRGLLAALGILLSSLFSSSCKRTGSFKLSQGQNLLEAPLENGLFSACAPSQPPSHLL